MRDALKGAALSLALLIPGLSAAQTLTLTPAEQESLYLREHIQSHPLFSEYYDSRLPSYFNIDGAVTTRTYDVSGCREISSGSRLARPENLRSGKYDCSNRKNRRSASLAGVLPTSRLPRSTVLTVNRKYSSRSGQASYMPMQGGMGLSGQYYNDAAIEDQSTLSPYFDTGSAYKRWLRGQ